MVFFMVFTLALAILLSYTVYLYFGVYGALQKIEVSIYDVSVQSLSVTNSSVRATVKTVITIQNPSGFSFGASAIRERLLFNGTLVGKSAGYYLRYPDDPLPIAPSPPTNVTAIMPDIQLFAEPTENSKWRMLVYIAFVTPLPGGAESNFDVQYP